MSGLDLSGRRILVTGAAAGIGAATARVLAGLGAELLLADRADATALADELGGAAFHVDLADGEALDRLVATVGRVDALVANAAICPWDAWTDPDWDAVFDEVMRVNLLAPIRLARALLPQMAERGTGRMVFVGSLAGKTGGLIASPHYVGSKGGLHAFVRWLARQAAPKGVIVNGVAPASIETPLMAGQKVDTSAIPVGRLGTAEEVAWPIAFLCSPAASFVCGTVIDVNGGVQMSG